MGAVESSISPVAASETGHVSVLCVCVCVFVSGTRAQLHFWLDLQMGKQQLCLGEAPGPWRAGLGSSVRAGGAWARGGGHSSYFHWAKELSKTTEKWCKFKAE